MDINAYLKNLTNYFLQIVKEDVFWQLKSQIFQKLFLLHIIFLKKFFCYKKIIYGIKWNIWFLFWRLYFIFPQKTINLFFNLKKNIIMIWIDMFPQCSYAISCIIYDYSFHSLRFWIYIQYWIIVAENTPHCYINFFVIIDTMKCPNTMHLCYFISKFFFCM